MRQLLGSAALDEAKGIAVRETADVALVDVLLTPVIPDPDKIIDVGMNYHDHVAEVGRTVTEKPSLFARFAGSQVGHLQPMIKPAVSEQFDYEGELAVVIGKGGRHIVGDRASLTSQVMAVTTKAVSATGSGTRRNSCSAGPSMARARSVPDSSPLTRSPTQRS